MAGSGSNKFNDFAALANYLQETYPGQQLAANAGQDIDGQYTLTLFTIDGTNSNKPTYQTTITAINNDGDYTLSTPRISEAYRAENSINISETLSWYQTITSLQEQLKTANHHQAAALINSHKLAAHNFQRSTLFTHLSLTEKNQIQEKITANQTAINTYLSKSEKKFSDALIKLRCENRLVENDGVVFYAEITESGDSSLHFYTTTEPHTYKGSIDHNISDNTYQYRHIVDEPKLAEDLRAGFDINNNPDRIESWLKGNELILSHPKLCQRLQENPDTATPGDIQDLLNYETNKQRAFEKWKGNGSTLELQESLNNLDKTNSQLRTETYEVLLENALVTETEIQADGNIVATLKSKEGNAALGTLTLDSNGNEKNINAGNINWSEEIFEAVWPVLATQQQIFACGDAYKKPIGERTEADWTAIAEYATKQAELKTHLDNAENFSKFPSGYQETLSINHQKNLDYLTHPEAQSVDQLLTQLAFKEKLTPTDSCFAEFSIADDDKTQINLFDSTGNYLTTVTCSMKEDGGLSYTTNKADPELETTITETMSLNDLRLALESNELISGFAQKTVATPKKLQLEPMQNYSIATENWMLSHGANSSEDYRKQLKTQHWKNLKASRAYLSEYPGIALLQAEIAKTSPDDNYFAHITEEADGSKTVALYANEADEKPTFIFTADTRNGYINYQKIEAATEESDGEEETKGEEKEGEGLRLDKEQLDNWLKANELISTFDARYLDKSNQPYSKDDIVAMQGYQQQADDLLAKLKRPNGSDHPVAQGLISIHQQNINAASNYTAHTTIFGFQDLLKKQNKTAEDFAQIQSYVATTYSDEEYGEVENYSFLTEDYLKELQAKDKQNVVAREAYLADPESPAILDVILKLQINHGLADGTQLQIYFTEDSNGNVQVNLFENNKPYSHISTITCISNGDGSFHYNTAPINPAPTLPLDEHDQPQPTNLPFSSLNQLLTVHATLNGFIDRCSNEPDSLESFQAIANYDNTNPQHLVNFSNGRCDKKLQKKLKTKLKSNLETRIDYLARESAVRALDKEITRLFGEKIEDKSLHAEIPSDGTEIQLYGQLKGQDSLSYLGEIVATEQPECITYKIDTTSASHAPDKSKLLDQTNAIERLTAFELAKNFASKCDRAPKDLRDFQHVFNYEKQTHHWLEKNMPDQWGRHKNNQKLRRKYLAKHSAIELLKQGLEAKDGLNDLDNVLVNIEQSDDAQTMTVRLYAKDGEKKHLQDIVWKIDSDGHIGYDLFEAKDGQYAPDSAAEFNPVEMLAGIEKIYSFKEKTERFTRRDHPERPTQQEIKDVVEYRQTTNQFLARFKDHLPEKQYLELLATDQIASPELCNTQIRDAFIQQHAPLESFKKLLAAQKIDLTKYDALIEYYPPDIAYTEQSNNLTINLFSPGQPSVYAGYISYDLTPGAHQLYDFEILPENQQVTPAPGSDDKPEDKPKKFDIIGLLERNEAIIKFQDRFPESLELTRLEDIQEIAQYINLAATYVDNDEPHVGSEYVSAVMDPLDATNSALRAAHNKAEKIKSFLIAGNPKIKPEDRYKLLAAFHHDQKVKANTPTGQIVDSSKLKLPGVTLPDGLRVLEKPGDGGSEPSYLLLDTDTEHTANVYEFTETQRVHLNTQSPDEGKDADEERPAGSTIAWHDQKSGVNYCLLSHTQPRVAWEESKEEDAQSDTEVRYSCYQLKDNDADWQGLDRNGQPRTTVDQGIEVPLTANRKLRESLLAETRQTLKRPLNELLLIGQYGNCHAEDKKINELDRDYVIMELAADPDKNIPQRYLVLNKQGDEPNHSYKAVALCAQTDKENDDKQQLCQFLAANEEQIKAYEKQTKQKLIPEKNVIDENAQRFSQYLTFQASSPIIRRDRREDTPSQLLHNPFISVEGQNQEEYRKNSVTIAIKQFESDKRLIDEAMLMSSQCRSDNDKPKLESQNGGKLYRELGERIRSLESTLKTMALSNPGPTEAEGTKAASYKEMAALCNKLKSTQQELGEVIKNHKEYFVTQDELIKQDFSTGSFRTQVVSEPTTKSCYARGGFGYTIHYSDENRNEVKKIKLDNKQTNRDPILHAIAVAEICDTSRKIAPGLSFAWEYTSDKSLLIEEIVNYLEGGRPMSRPFSVTHADLRKIIDALNPPNRSDTDYTSSKQLAAAGNIRNSLSNNLNARCLFDLAWGNPMIAQCLKQYDISNPNALKPASISEVIPGHLWGTRTVQRELTINALDIIKQQQRQLVRSEAKLAEKDDTVQSNFGFSRTEGKTPVASKQHHLRTYTQPPERQSDSIIGGKFNHRR